MIVQLEDKWFAQDTIDRFAREVVLQVEKTRSEEKEIVRLKRRAGKDSKTTEKASHKVKNHLI